MYVTNITNDYDNITEFDNIIYYSMWYFICMFIILDGIYEYKYNRM